jgi:hypothetical protein
VAASLKPHPWRLVAGAALIGAVVVLGALALRGEAPRLDAAAARVAPAAHAPR